MWRGSVHVVSVLTRRAGIATGLLAAYAWYVLEPSLAVAFAAFLVAYYAVADVLPKALADERPGERVAFSVLLVGLCLVTGTAAEGLGVHRDVAVLVGALVGPALHAPLSRALTPRVFREEWRLPRRGSAARA